MLELTRAILSGIKADDCEMFLAASEVARAFAFGTEPDVGLIDPYDAYLLANPPCAEDIEAITKAVVRYLKSPGRHMAAATFVLGSLRDETLVPILRDCLHSQLELLSSQNQVVVNLICALDNHGESIDNSGEYSFADITKNVEDSIAYLKGVGRMTKLY